MSAYQRAVPVLQVANVETSLRWYVEVPKSPPYSFAILRRDGAEIMLQCADEERAGSSRIRKSDPEFLWSVQLLRGPERMFYGLVEFEVCDPDGYRICVGGEAPPGANVKRHEERR